MVAVLSELGPASGRRALDLASGRGRHALALARAGWHVTAMDVSGEALNQLVQHARGAGLHIETRRADLDAPQPLLAADLVVIVDYLDRALLERLAQNAAVGTHAVVVTFTEDWPAPRPSARFRLARGELSGLPGWRTVRRTETGGRAGLWAHRAHSSAAADSTSST